MWKPAPNQRLVVGLVAVAVLGVVGLAMAITATGPAVNLGATPFRTLSAALSSDGKNVALVGAFTVPTGQSLIVTDVAFAGIKSVGGPPGIGLSFSACVIENGQALLCRTIANVSGNQVLQSDGHLTTGVRIGSGKTATLSWFCSTADNGACGGTTNVVATGYLVRE